ncbi:glycosyltransferase family 1 protein [uncultured Sphingobacterium sp.]|uniref:glycosyltransferase family 4 protein n=1 Tax=uncultured Sphingobacterium sp. TaxID=182688 RepID=UPI0025F5C11F|nr:glycosyltransferase family 1 protein [uncultured Sphingobacterium sp.]
MRIGFDAKRYFLNKTGLGNYSRDLIRILEKYAPENEYLKYTPKTGHQYIHQPTAQNNIRLPQGLINTTWPYLWRNQRIVDDLKKDKVDIFHGLSGEIPLGLAKAHIKSIVTIHDLIFMRHPELYHPIDRWIYKKKFKHACETSDRIVAISQCTKNDIVDLFHIPEEKIDVVYQGCHEAFKSTKTSEQKADLRNKLKLPQEFLLNVGTIEARKNILSVVKAIKDLDIPLVIVGKPTRYHQQILAYIQQNNMEHRIHFLQGLAMEELAILYASATVFIYPSIYEGFGIPIIEALYSGTPVITSNMGVFPEAGGPASCYIDPTNISQIQHAIKSLLSDSSKRDEMIKKGLEFVKKFNDANLAAQWKKQYLTL